MGAPPIETLDDVLALDEAARRAAEGAVERVAIARAA